MATGSQQPHRGILVLVLGILGFFVCICGPIAWWLGNNDLKEMSAGRMDPSGRDLTNIGKILGMIATILMIIGIIIWLLIMMLGLGLAGLGAAAG